MKNIKTYKSFFKIEESVMDLRKAIENNDSEYIKNWCYTSPEIGVVCSNWRLDADSIKELAYQLVNGCICDAGGVLACVEEVLDTMDAFDLTAKEACLELGANSGLRSQFFHDEHTDDLVEQMDFTKINF